MSEPGDRQPREWHLYIDDIPLLLPQLKVLRSEIV